MCGVQGPRGNKGAQRGPNRLVGGQYRRGQKDWEAIKMSTLSPGSEYAFGVKSGQEDSSTTVSLLPKQFL
ncbi:MAG: hypothetical protein A2Z24_02305 [Candidatus Woykebacteria bacterium RBG_16_44_10]|uniref:Uncharacterized protein n=1 Tax=Candidatus Woykebacteria bacterium RBG_16_44_10 TaxID=1802597 RepID=A0A1G1WFY8_9BACT|nr:MAG: hypothetical protein A2Z24_02305 [Candidatus Woykebacteria bacterium RBG_16_44_10]